MIVSANSLSEQKAVMSETVGQQLQNARLERKLTLQEVAHTTHIRLHYLEALEQDQRDVLPSMVQGRGFLRLYAGFLGLDAQPLLDGWDGKRDQLAPEPPSAKEPPKRRLPWRREPLVVTLPPEGSPAPDEAEEEDPSPVAGSSSDDQPESAAALSPENPLAAQPTPLATETPVEPEAPAVSWPEPPAESMAVTFEEIFQEVGLALRKQRELLSLKISDIERFTHIRYRYIEALEKGLIDEMPSPVQGRGMLNNYARFLDLDADRLLLRFADGLQARRKEYASATRPQQKRGARGKRAAQPTPSNPVRRFFTPDLIIGGAVIVFLFGFAIWGASQISAIRQEDASVNAGEATLEPVTNIMLTVSPAPDETPTATLIPTVSIIEPGAPPLVAAGNSEEVPVNANPDSTSAAGDATNPAPSGSAPLQLYIVANQRAFLKIVADQKEVFNGRVLPGNAYQFSGKDEIELLTGNAAALQVFFNQTDLGTLGSVGQISSLVFNQQGLTTPTAIFTATPTTTTQPTQTLVPTGTVRPQPTPTITPYIP